MPAFTLIHANAPSLESQVRDLSAAAASLAEVRESADRLNDSKLQLECEHAIKDLMEAIRTLSAHAKYDVKEMRQGD